ncbi:MAG: TerB family tellurite resistance protein [Sorangiineae bacterium]|nr:TerB family tellurite resistance protein [Polyangiaceae bacterium]MEB2322576.1 TerB family tellurite resistance protein [Sorangiineae bacterium]
MVLRLSEDVAKELSARLRERGAPGSVALTATHEDTEAALIVEEYGPLCEVMVLIMVADGEIHDAEREVLRGALRQLEPRVRTSHLVEMLARAESARAREGVEARLRAVAAALEDDPVRGEVAYVLGAAVAWADDDVSLGENALLEELAEALGIGEARSEELLRLLLA